MMPVTSSAPLTARQEWATMWQLPLTAMLGIAGISTFAYSNGVFLVEITREFGWTRAQFASAFTFQMLVGILAAPFAGRLVDRFGSRRVVAIAILPQIVSIALLGAIDGSVTQWLILCTAQGLIAAFVAPAVWLAAVVGRFDASRGLAVAVGLAGLGFASMIWPIISAAYVQWLGWRLAFPALSATFAIVILPLIYFYFYSAKERPGAAAADVRVSKTALLPALRSRTFIFVTIAAGLFGSVSLGLNFHMVPLMRSRGFDLTTAAALTSTIGFASFMGRLGTGFLLDRLPTRTMGVFVFLVPVIVVAMLLNAGTSLPIYFAAAIVFGLASGAETDIITYVVARKMPDIFGTAYAIIISIVGASASLGPLLAGRLYDLHGSYDLFLMLIVPAVCVGAVLIWLLPPIPRPGQTAVPAQLASNGDHS